jgi:hypothetical protein
LTPAELDAIEAELVWLDELIWEASSACEIVEYDRARQRLLQLRQELLKTEKETKRDEG